jgi:hypothetical protein
LMTIGNVQQCLIIMPGIRTKIDIFMLSDIKIKIYRKMNVSMYIT